MILCIDKNNIPQAQEVQRSVRLDEILSHTKYFNNTEEALKSSYVPIDFMVSIRSAYTNLVLERDCEDINEKRYYINMTQVDTLPHKGYDLIMYLASVGIITSVNYTLEVDKIMMQSQFCPIGFYNPNPDIMNPIVYSQVILLDETAEQFQKYLKDGCRLVHIRDMQTEGNLSAILDTIICVKEEQNEPTENDNH